MISRLIAKAGRIIAVAMLAFVPVLVPAAAYAATSTTSPDITNNLCSSADTLQVDGGGNCDTANAANQANNIIATVINIFSVVVGVVAVIMIIYGGFRYITSGGDSGKITSAKNTIIYALIGLVVVALSQFIVKFVLAKVTGI
jgi:hypothetical protein